MELALRTQGNAKLWINGEEPKGTPGNMGLVVEMPKARNLVMFRVTNTGGAAGFTCKILEPGRVPAQAAEGVTVWLGPL